jgi:hypothetical protein
MVHCTRGTGDIEFSRWIVRLLRLDVGELITFAHFPDRGDKSAEFCGGTSNVAENWACIASLIET